MAAISLSALREYCYYLVLSSNTRVKGDRMRRENNPMAAIRGTWCSLSVPQCAASKKETEPLDEFLVSKETVVLRRWKRSKQKFGFIKRVGKG